MLRCEKISKTFYPGTNREIKAIDELSFDMHQGEFVMMLGENGAGKTTLLNLIGGQLYPDFGKIFLNGKEITALPPHKRAFLMTRVYQSRDSGLPQAMTVREVIRLAMDSREIAGLRRGKRELMCEIIGRLEQIRKGLSTLLPAQMWSLSGGEHQLVSLAIASILSERKQEYHGLLLLDEHVSQLDPIAHDTVMDITDRLIKNYGLSAIMTTQNHEVAAKYGTRQIILSHGKIVHDFTCENRVKSAENLTDLLKSTVAKPWGK